MGDFVCTDESLSDEERHHLKWDPIQAERAAAADAAKPGRSKAVAPAEEKSAEKPPEKAIGRTASR
jgi:hypothetical protein